MFKISQKNWKKWSQWSYKLKKKKKIQKQYLRNRSIPNNTFPPVLKQLTTSVVIKKEENRTGTHPSTNNTRV